MNKRMLLLLMIIALLVSSAGIGLAAPVAVKINYSKATTLAFPVRYTFRFSLWDVADGGTETPNMVWWEAKDITMTTKTLTTALGSVTNPAYRSDLLDNLDFATQYWVQVDRLEADGVTWTQEGGRTKFLVVPYAAWSAQGGDVTSVIAGDGLASSGETGDVSIEVLAGAGLYANVDGVGIQYGGVTSAMLADGAVATADLADGSVTDAKIAGPISASKIGSTGLNADTVDGKHAADLASASHSHDTAYVNAGGDSMTGALNLTINGTTLFPAALHVNGNYGAVGTGRSIVFGDTTDYVRLRDVVEAGAQVGFSIDTAGNQSRIYVKHGGNVGIGTTNPTQKLEVNGTVKATSFVGNGSGLTNTPKPKIATSHGGGLDTIGKTCTNPYGGSVSITVPAAGTISVDADVWIGFNHISGTYDWAQVYLGTSKTDCTHNDYAMMTVEAPFNLPAMRANHSVHVMRTITVGAAGTYTYYVNGIAGGTGQDAEDYIEGFNLRAVYYPN